MKFDQNLSAIHAYLCADGYVIKNPSGQKHKYYLIGLRNKNKILLHDFQKRFKKFFNVRPKLCNDGRCKINSKALYFNLMKYGPYYSNRWVLPKLSKENLRIWLRTFFDCEAWLELNGRQNRRIGLDSINHRGLIQIQQKLSNIFKINSIIKKKKNRKIFRLCIFGKANLIKFEKEIGFLHPIKKERLREIIKSYPSYKWNFPKERRKLKQFINILMKRKAKIKKPYIIRLVSNIKNNLVILSHFLYNLYKIESKVYDRINRHGTNYYELVIQKKVFVKKALKHGLLNKKEKNKIRNIGGLK